MEYLKYFFSDTRAKVYLVWLVVVLVGFIATNFYQMKAINGVWAVMSALALIYMYRVMPMGQPRMKHIFAIWLLVIIFGMAVSGLVFYIDAFTWAVGYLGVFWMFLMAVGFFANGVVDPPRLWYIKAGIICVLGGLACIWSDTLLQSQYLIAAAVSGIGMGWLWLLRSQNL